ncbi:outer membrane assembly lipoprotein YfgL [Mycobacteroides abscessus subsp. abscessus]|uniref:outer membrane protein assembly factor BamB family protein n=1 Tax=Mycobacteroides abscessus TaxID=36809 RepID=UPI00092A3435|nr:PQQ-binding-like beta-propeller repeat protein [Mycobacteroides abscessus]SIH37056.1 outer membrane assembly lipoprotein YfgL [Mycobacteroides abscessus subsp. abscessus]
MNTSSDRTAAEQNAPQPALLAGATIGLALAAILCAAIAWLRFHASTFDDPRPLTLMWRTTFVVAGATLLVTAYLWWPGQRLQRSSARLSRFLAATAAVPAAAALVAVATLHNTSTNALFRAVGLAQQRAGGPVVTAAAREAWWLAALAVAGVALIAATGYLRPGSPPLESVRPRPRGRATAALAAATATALVVPLALAGTPPRANPRGAGQLPHSVQVAAPAAAPPIPATIQGQVAYRIDAVAYNAPVIAAGAGFVTEMGDGTAPARLVGFDGATGQQRWSYELAAPKIASWMASSTGEGSVVVAVISDAITGIDATTGAQLWRRALTTNDQAPYVHVSPTVVLIEQAMPRELMSPTTHTALAIRTGEQLWTQTGADTCGSSWLLGQDTVLVPSCDPARPDVAATLLDPATGAAREQVWLSELGINASDLHRDFGDIRFLDERGATATLEIRKVRPERSQTVAALDLITRRLLATAPPEQFGYLLNSGSMVLFGRAGASILNLHTQAIVPIGLRTRGTGDWGIHPQVVAVGAGWVTSLFTAAEADKRLGTPAMSALRTLDSSGAQRALPTPCAPDVNPAIASLAPGALLVRCANQVVGMR